MKLILIVIITISMISCAANQHVSTEMPYSKAKSILLKNNYVDITEKYDLGFVSGHAIWLSPDKTALLIVLYHPEPDAKIYQMTLGEKGKGFENWSTQNLQDLKVLR